MCITCMTWSVKPAHEIKLSQGEKKKIALYSNVKRLFCLTAHAIGSHTNCGTVKPQPSLSVIRSVQSSPVLKSTSKPTSLSSFLYKHVKHGARSYHDYSVPPALSAEINQSKCSPAEEEWSLSVRRRHCEVTRVLRQYGSLHLNCLINI